MPITFADFAIFFLICENKICQIINNLKIKSAKMIFGWIRESLLESFWLYSISVSKYNMYIYGDLTSEISGS